MPHTPSPSAFPSYRPRLGQRAFFSFAAETRLAAVRSQIPHPELAWLFENCYPNTLDTTVTYRVGADGPDTFVIAGDIPAMWLRDSTAQLQVYLPLARGDERLQALFRGVIARQARCVRLDPYANAFYPGAKRGDWQHDATEMKPGVHERKWELDSLCYPIQLAHAYWRATEDRVPFDAHWHETARLIVATMKSEQRLDGQGPYHFARKSEFFYDNSPNRGAGAPTRKTGLIHSAFRPSDDCCIFPFLIPSNLFANKVLRDLAEIATEVLNDDPLAQECLALANTLQAALARHATCDHPVHGIIYAYEVDGFGNALMMDDANLPSLLALPYLGCCAPDDPLYLRTRAYALSTDNPYFHHGQFAEGIGSTHVSPTTIWPLSIILRALTSTCDDEITTCLRMLLQTHAGAGFMHESFDPDNPQKFTRPWFAGCNSLFGELIVHLAEKRPELLAEFRDERR